MKPGVKRHRPKRAYHHGDLRRVLLDGAAALLERVGSEALSIREVARAAGVSSRAPYRHFRDKEALLSELAAEAFVAFGEALAAADAAAPPGREIESQAVAYVRFAMSAPGRFRLMFGPRRSVPEGELAAAKPHGFNVLQARIDTMSAPGEDRPAKAMAFWSLAHGLAVLFLDGLARDRMEGTQDEIVRRVAASFAPATSQGRSGLEGGPDEES